MNLSKRIYKPKPPAVSEFTLRSSPKSNVKNSRNLRISPIRRQRRLRKSSPSKPTTIQTSTPVSSMPPTSPKPDLNNFPTPKLNYENSLVLQPIIQDVKEKREAEEQIKQFNDSVELSDPVYIAARKARDSKDIGISKKNFENLREFQEIQWLSKRGQAEKKKRTKRNDEYMMLWFDFLDVDGDESVSAEELEDPLVSLGLAKNRNEAEKLVKMYDQDGDMELDFDEFRKLLQGKRVNKGRVPLKDRMYRKKHSKKRNGKSNYHNTTESRIDAMFDKISSGSVRSADGLPLDMSISAYRRKLLMDANMSPRDDDKRKGMYVLQGIIESRNAAQKALAEQKKLAENGKMIQPQKPVGLSMFRQLAHRVSLNDSYGK